MHGDSHLAAAMLPSVVQTRLPALRALRKSISWTELWVVPMPRLSRSRPSSTISTPPSSPPLDAVATRDGVELAQDDGDEVVRAFSAGTGHSAHQRSSRTPPLTPLTPGPQQDGSGVKWKYAQQGSMLHALGTQQGGNDAAFTRKSYIDGVSYLLRALPDDLDEHEAAIIEQSLPAKCLAPTSNQLAVRASPQQQQHDWHYSQHSQQSHGEALFRRTIRKAALQFVLLMYLLAKLITVLVRVGAQYERRYNISQHIISRGLGVASALGRCGVSISSSVAHVGDGRLGQAVMKFGTWTADLVAGAVSDGLREGFEIISSQPQPSQKPGW